MASHLRRLVSLAAAGALCVGLSASPAWGQPQPSPTPEAAPSPSEGSADETKPPVWDVVGRAEHALNSWVRGLVASSLEPVFRVIGRTILWTPQLDGHSRIRELWAFSLRIADAALILFVLAGCVVVMVGGFSSQLTFKELLPRLLLAAGAVHLALPLAGLLISTANAVSLAIVTTAADVDGLSSRMSELLFRAGLASPLFLILALVVVVIAVLVVVAYVVRVAVLAVLLAAGPLALVTHALPQTDHLARAWWRLLVAMIVAPVFQTLVLATAVRVFLSSEGVLGIGSGSLIDLLVIGCLLYLLYRIPLWTIHAALGGAASRAWVSAKSRALTAAKTAVAA
ncbi:MAG: hypothetical protein ACRDJ4_04960 [Actinomycetota bacterium]